MGLTVTDSGELGLRRSECEERMDAWGWPIAEAKEVTG